MALILEGNYSKKIGLAGYSSHQFSLTLKTELSDLTQVPAETARLYQQLQDGVDASIKQVGWLPTVNGNGDHPRSGNGHTNGNGRSHGQPAHGDAWNCTAKQQELILRIVDENRLDKNEIERLAQDRFGKGVKLLNKLEASGLIEELFEKYPRQRSHGRQTTPAR